MEAEIKKAQDSFKKEPKVADEPMLRWFSSDGLEEPIAGVVTAYGNLARAMVKFFTPSAERSAALRKLLESKDAAIRAMFTVAE